MLTDIETDRQTEGEKEREKEGRKDRDLIKKSRFFYDFAKSV